MMDTLRESLTADPFVPFRIAMTSGQTFDVTNPQLVALGKTQIVVCYPKSDRFAVLRLNQIASFETLDERARR